MHVPKLKWFGVGGYLHCDITMSCLYTLLKLSKHSHNNVTYWSLQALFSQGVQLNHLTGWLTNVLGKVLRAHFPPQIGKKNLLRN